MKKFFAVLVILAVVCTTVFAVNFNLHVGAGYQYSCGKIQALTPTIAGYVVPCFPENSKIRFGGFHPEIGFDVEFNNHLVIYDNLGLSIVRKLDFYSPTFSSWYDFGSYASSMSNTTLDYKSRFAVVEDVGVGYAFNFAQARLVTGVGFHSEFLLIKFNSEDENIKKNNNTITNLGVNFLVKFDYMFAEHCGLFIALEPNLNLYNSYNFKQVQVATSQDSSDFKASGSKMGFSGTAVAGINFKF